MTASPSLTHIPAIHRSRAADFTLWIVQIALAAMFLMAGTSKLSGVAPMVALFDAVGIGQWFRYATGLIEVGSAIALLIPRAAVFGALVLVPTMVGAIMTQLFIVHASPVAPAILLGGAVLVLAVRRRELGSALPTGCQS
jgi:putative oxidoreductase